MATYIAILMKQRRKGFRVVFPDLPGCVTAGSTLDEARRNAEDALALHLQRMATEHAEIPEPSALERILPDPANREVPFLVEAPDPQVRAVRVNITLPEPVLARIDAHVARTGNSRSAFLAEAAIRAIRPVTK